MKNKETRIQRIFLSGGMIALLCVLSIGLCFAEETSGSWDLLASLDKLKTLIYSIISIVGGIITAFGFFQFGTSFPAHDPTQRSQGLMYIAGGLIVAAAPWAVNYILS